MDRRDSILKYVTKEQNGIEIGPWFNPVVPKRDGYRCLVLDVFDAATLRQRALGDPNVPDNAVAAIEEVDLIGSSTSIGELVEAAGKAGSIDYIVSSHNFEHLPDPIRFLQGCARILKPGGMLSMAIPDRRACFDYFRPVTRLSEWIQSYIDKRDKPSPSQNFDSSEVFAHIQADGKRNFAFFRDMPAEQVKTDADLRRLYSDWLSRLKDADQTYYDAHCSVFTPASFELLIRDVGLLGLVPFEIIEVFDAGCEFHAHLRLRDTKGSVAESDYGIVRNVLLQRIQNESAETSQYRQSQSSAGKAESLLLNEHILSQRAEVEAARAKVRELEEIIVALQVSTSWRATAPLRRGVSILRTLRGRLR